MQPTLIFFSGITVWPFGPFKLSSTACTVAANDVWRPTPICNPTHQQRLHAKIPTRWCGQQPTEKQVLGSTDQVVALPKPSAEGNKCERTTGYHTPFRSKKESSFIYSLAYSISRQPVWRATHELWRDFEPIVVKQIRLCTFYSQLSAMWKHWFGDTSSGIFSLLGLPSLTNWSVWGSLYRSKLPSMQSM